MKKVAMVLIVVICFVSIFGVMVWLSDGKGGIKKTFQKKS